MTAEYFSTSGGGSRPLEVARGTTLRVAEEWLRPSLRRPLTTGDSRRDWWPALRLELLNLARHWLDIEATLARLPTETSEIQTWRRRWWSLQPRVGEIDVGHLPPSHLVGLARSPEIGDRLKSFGLDLEVRRLQSIARTPQMIHKCVTLCIAEIPTPSMTESLFTVATSSDDAVLSADPRVLKLARSCGLKATSVWNYPRAVRPPRVKALEPVIAQRLNATSPQFATLVSRGVARVWARLLGDNQRMIAAIQELQPEVIAMASDQHRYGVLACWAGHDLQIPTVVFQHGLPSDPAGFTPPRADWYLTYGESSNSAFREFGVPAHRTVAVGMPRREGRLTNAGEYLLLPLQPVDDGLSLDLVRIVAETGLPTVLRLHPGDSRAQALADHDVLRERGWPDTALPTIDRNRSPDESLAKAAAVVTHDSTFAVDAARRGLNVFVYSGFGRRSPLASSFPEFRSAAELRELFDRRDTTLEFRASSTLAYDGAGAISKSRAFLNSLRSP